MACGISGATPTVEELFSGQSVLVTGGTGFLGAVLLEKLLRSCSKLKHIYLLVRPRGGKDVTSRVNQLLNKPVFANHCRESLERIKAVSGDVSLPGLGLSASDRTMLRNEVSIVFHAAATINFNAPLISAVKINVLGTRQVLHLCQQMAQLKALVYVSTAYCNCTVHEEAVYERVYRSVHDPDSVIRIVETTDAKELKEITPSLLGDHPNSYSFTKQLAENLLEAERGNVPVAIVRPSIVMGTWRSPMPGWVDNVRSGSFAFIAGAIKGVFRVALADPDKVADIVPADHVANLMVAAAWSAAVAGKNSELQVYHMTSGTTNPLLWREYVDVTIEKCHKLPCKEMTWYPGAKCRKGATRAILFVYLFHMLPAIFVDLIARFAGRKPELLDIQKKYYLGMHHVRYFTTNEWRFCTNRADQLHSRLSVQDKEHLYFNASNYSWPEYLEKCVLGVRQYYHNETLDTVPAAKLELRIWRCVHWATHIIMFATLLYFSSQPLGLSLAAVLSAIIVLIYIWF